MDQIQFCYWLKGFIDVNEAAPTSAQWKIISSMLNNVLEPKPYNKTTYRDATSIKNYKPHDDWTKVRFENVPAKEEPDAYL